ncbi:hypothetical protein RN001_011855 [Aquatica leii]|uniref:Centromere protein S n=1 Tax=Aquatica leii TaxID=1421715 RepID=A0AAN7QE76_9COLE|nr:hypothetical protein RN001_011855 [Aquatica leii]
MSLEQKLQTAIYDDVRKICREVGIYLDMEYESSGIDIIAEMTWKKLQSYASDLEAFQKHGKRSTITADDVKLLVRNNQSLKDLLDLKIKEIATAKAEMKIRKRKRKSSPDKKIDHIHEQNLTRVTSDNSKKNKLRHLYRRLNYISAIVEDEFLSQWQIAKDSCLRILDSLLEVGESDVMRQNDLISIIETQFANTNLDDSVNLLTSLTQHVVVSQSSIFTSQADALTHRIIEDWITKSQRIIYEATCILAKRMQQSPQTQDTEPDQSAIKITKKQP